MSDKVAKYAVVHPKLTLAVEGVLERQPVGRVLTLTKAQATKMGARVSPVSDKGSADLSKGK